MPRPTPAALLALCLLVGTVTVVPVPLSGPTPTALPVPTSSPSPAIYDSFVSLPAESSPHAESIAVLSLDGPARTRVTTQSLDVAGTIAIQREAASARLGRLSLAVAFERTADGQARRELLIQAATDVEIDISELRTLKRDLRSRYVSGEITTVTFLRRRVVLDAHAEQLLRDIELILEYADRVPRLSMSSRVDALEASLIGFDGPVTTRAAEAMTGEEDPIRLYVAASENGTVLAMIDDERYVRESFRSDHWTFDSSSGTGLDGLDQVEARTRELYSAVFNSSNLGLGIYPVVDTGLYQVDIRRSEQWTIVAYIDGDTRDVFYEIQRRPLEEIHPGESISTVDNGTRLTVNETFSGGPLRIAVAEEESGDPVDAEVLVDDVSVRTGPDGVAWTLMPVGSARVTAVTSAGNTTLLVDANKSNSVNEVPDGGQLTRRRGVTVNLEVGEFERDYFT